MCLPQVIKSFQNYRGVATTFYPTLVYYDIVITAVRTESMRFNRRRMKAKLTLGPSQIS
jgi:dsDNA-specific endonuclease/ATPase MutS2